MTVHFVALRRNLALVPEDEMPGWRDHRRAAPGAAHPSRARRPRPRHLARPLHRDLGLLRHPRASRSPSSPRRPGGCHRARDGGPPSVDGLEDAGRGMVIIGVLLAGAQVLVSMINLTGIGVTLSSLIVSCGRGFDRPRRADRRPGLPDHGDGPADDRRLCPGRGRARAGDDGGRRRLRSRRISSSSTSPPSR